MSKKRPAAAPAPSLAEVQATFRACAPVFAALGDPFRQEIVMLLTQHERLNVNQITEHVALSRPAVSHHLKVLLRAGIVVMERVSREHYYVLTIDPCLALLETLVEQANAVCAAE